MFVTIHFDDGSKLRAPRYEMPTLFAMNYVREMHGAVVPGKGMSKDDLVNLLEERGALWPFRVKDEVRFPDGTAFGAESDCIAYLHRLGLIEPTDEAYAPRPGITVNCLNEALPTFIFNRTMH